MSARRRHLFEGFGVELEYMIVDSLTLDVKPIADKVLFAAAGKPVYEVELGDVAWSNELVLHVLEMKTNGPAPALAGLAERFQRHVQRANGMLASLGACLLPSSMHPWMDPRRETRLWPHEQNSIYKAYDRIFGTKGHGWSNVQCTHINLPYCGNDEFVRLHGAIRAVLPLIPSLAASSPVADAKLTGQLDTRLEYYRNNQKKIPSITGRVIPEAVRSIKAYRRDILGAIYRDIEPFDADHILRHEWLNSRGAIARFERGAIEIRIMDIQECPGADLAVVAAVSHAVQALAEEKWVPMEELLALALEELESVFLASLREGAETLVASQDLLRAFGARDKGPVKVSELWQHLIGSLLDDGEPEIRASLDALHKILDQGTLARRLLKAFGPAPSRGRLEEVYRELATCLENGVMFEA